MTVADAVVLRGLVRTFGATAAVDEMTWSAGAGQVTAVLGPNGAGKTTAVECAAGLQRPDGGEVRVLGSDPWGADANHRARVGMMLQEGGLPGAVRPMSLLHHLAALYAEPADVDALADRLGVPAFAGTPTRRLSGGQRQRLALAAALIGQPDVAFLDEPTAGLDPHARLEVWELLRETRSRGCAVVLTTHSFEEAERLADHVVVLSRGRVVAAGPLALLTVDMDLESLYFSLTREVPA